MTERLNNNLRIKYRISKIIVIVYVIIAIAIYYLLVLYGFDDIAFYVMILMWLLFLLVEEKLRKYVYNFILS